MRVEFQLQKWERNHTVDGAFWIQISSSTNCSPPSIKGKTGFRHQFVTVPISQAVTNRDIISGIAGQNFMGKNNDYVKSAFPQYRTILLKRNYTFGPATCDFAKPRRTWMYLYIRNLRQIWDQGRFFRVYSNISGSKYKRRVNFRGSVRANCLKIQKSVGDYISAQKHRNIPEITGYGPEPVISAGDRITRT